MRIGPAKLMLLCPTIVKKARLLSVVIGTAVVSLAMSLYLLARPLVVQRLWSHAINRTRAGTPPASFGISVPPAPILHITTVVQHGRIVEIEGTTEPGSIVMINGQAAATIFEGNSFRHFVGPLPAGTTMIAVTCQNERGGVNTQQLAVTME
jgi:hypothetical protein